MKIFLSRHGIYLSKTTIHKYMNNTLNSAAVIMGKKPGYKASKRHKIFDNLLKRNFDVDEKNKIWRTDFTYMRQPNGRFRYNCSIIAYLMDQQLLLLMMITLMLSLPSRLHLKH